MPQRELFPIPPPAASPDREGGTRVVNLRREPFDVYIGRSSDGKPPRFCKPGEAGYLGNPHPVKSVGRVMAMRWFRRYAYERLVAPADATFRAEVEKLRGKRLGCFCKNAKGQGDCHGDVYVEWLTTGTIVVDRPEIEEPST